MLYFKNDEWCVSEFKVIYTDNGKAFENYSGFAGKQWWLDVESMHEGVHINEFVEVSISDEQQTRLDTINTLNIEEVHGSTVLLYVLEGKFPEKTGHILKDLENKAERGRLEIDQTMNSMESLGALTTAIQGTQVEQADQYMEIMSLITALQGGDQQ